MQDGLMIKDDICGMVFNIQRFSIHDGPGIRTTIFFKGCTLRCFWCHNPESLAPGPEIMFLTQKCIGCGKCLEVCPEHAHRLDEAGGRIFDRSLCRRCGKCVETCYAGALEMSGRMMSVREAADEAEKDKAFYDNSGGGVTLSGGEPLMQDEFAGALLAELKRRGMNTAVETAGNVPWKAFEKVIPYTDLFLYDIKVSDTARHKEVTGSGNERCHGNLRKLAAAGACINIRIPVIPGVNDTEEEMRQIAGIIKSTGHSIPVSLLPYHRLGEGKYTGLGLEYRTKGLEAPSEEKMKLLNSVFTRITEGR